MTKKLKNKPDEMSDEIWEQYKIYQENPNKFKSLYPIIYKCFIEPFLLKDKTNEKD
jgi:hypothetical protein